MQEITTIIFDFGGVLFDIDFKKSYKAFADIGVNDLEKMYSPKYVSPLFQHLEEGKLNQEKFYDAFRKETNSSLTDDQIKNAWNALLQSFRKEAFDKLKQLRSKYKLYLLSNTNIIHYDQFNKIYKEEIGEGSLDMYFDAAYYSQIIGLRKPDKEAYEYVLKENYLDPSQTLFIDDTLQNIEGAKAVGLQTIHLKNGMRITHLDL